MRMDDAPASSPRTDLRGFTLPHDADAEAAAVGSFAMADEVTQRRIRLRLAPSDFYVPAHGLVYAAACTLLDAGRPLDAVTLGAALRESGRLPEVGGIGGLVELLGTVPNPMHGEHYADKVFAYSQRRQAIRAMRAAAARLEGDVTEAEVAAVIRGGASSLVGIANRHGNVSVWSLEEAVHGWLDRREQGHQPALETGIGALDAYVGVFRFGGYTLVGGRPSQGKSTLVRWLLGEWARAGTPVGIVALEEDRDKIAGNYLSAETGIENDHLAYHKLGTAETGAVLRAIPKLAAMKWHGCDTAFTLSEVSAAVETLAVEKGCRVIAVDHIHLVQHEGRAESRNVALTEMSGALKRLARLHNVVLVVAAQLSRPPKQQGIPDPPKLTDLRESGSLEQDADAVLMVHREDYYRPRETPTHAVEIGIEKNRNGKRGVAVLREELMYQRFAEQYADAFG